MKERTVDAFCLDSYLPVVIQVWNKRHNHYMHISTSLNNLKEWPTMYKPTRHEDTIAIFKLKYFKPKVQ